MIIIKFAKRDEIIAHTQKMNNAKYIDGKLVFKINSIQSGKHYLWLSHKWLANDFLKEFNAFDHF